MMSMRSNASQVFINKGGPLLTIKSWIVLFTLCLGSFVVIGHESPYMEGQEHVGVEYPDDDIDRSDEEISEDFDETHDEDRWEYLGEWDETDSETNDDYAE